MIIGVTLIIKNRGSVFSPLFLSLQKIKYYIHLLDFKILQGLKHV